MGMGQDIDLTQFILQLEKAIAGGVATLDGSAKVPKTQISLTASDVGAIATETDPTVSSFTKGLTTNNTVLSAVNAASGTISADRLPSYVDDVLSYANLAGFPVTGETGKIYAAEDSSKVYRWTGSVYVDISSAATADTALKLTNARTITATGDASYSVSFDGSANVTSGLTLATVNNSAGTFGGASTIPTITVNSKGLVTSVSTNSISSDLTNLNASNLSSGTVNDARLSSNVGLLTGVQTFTGAKTFSGITRFSNTTESSSTTTGGALFSGGVAVVKNVNIGGTINGVNLSRGGGNVATNLAFGVSALQSNTSGTWNLAFGGYALLSNTTGTWNLAFGGYALRSNTTGTWNLAFGGYALRSNTTGNYNSAFGTYALRYNAAGNYNSAFGNEAGSNLANGSSLLTTINNSCFIGANTKGTQSATNENVFGYNATGNGSNTATIGDSNITATHLRGNIFVNGTQALTTRRTGWVAATGTATRTTFDTDSVTLVELARRVKALTDDLITHGLIGA